MSVNIYLSEDVRKAPGFSSTPSRDGSGNRTRIGDVEVWSRDGRLHIMHNIKEPIPEIVTRFVTEVSYYDCFPVYVPREPGVYSHKTARAVVDIEGPTSKRDNGPKFQVQVVAKNIEDAREIVHLFRLGEIRPTESFMGDQQGLSRKELEAELERLRECASAFNEERANLETELSALDKEKAELQDTIAQLRGEIESCKLKNLPRRIGRWIAKSAKALRRRVREIRPDAGVY